MRLCVCVFERECVFECVYVCVHVCVLLAANSQGQVKVLALGF